MEGSFGGLKETAEFNATPAGIVRKQIMHFFIGQAAKVNRHFARCRVGVAFVLHFPGLDVK